MLLNKATSSLLTGIDKELEQLPELHFNMVFSTSLAFKDFLNVYDSFDVTTKLCSLHFAVLLANEVIKKKAFGAELQVLLFSGFYKAH